MATRCILHSQLGMSYQVVPINIGAGEQFKPEFLAINPNHRIPAIVDPEGPGGKPLKLFESGAILIYLAEKAGGKLIPKDPATRYICLEWLMFQMGGVGPMFGQWNHFAAYAVEKLPYAIERYTNEVARLHRVMEHRLQEAPYLAGDEYTIADRHIPLGPQSRPPRHRPRRLPLGQALARRDRSASGRAAWRCGAGRSAAAGFDHRQRAREFVRQDPIRRALKLRGSPSAPELAGGERCPLC